MTNRILTMLAGAAGDERSLSLQLERGLCHRSGSKVGDGINETDVYIIDNRISLKTSSRPFVASGFTPLPSYSFGVSLVLLPRNNGWNVESMLLGQMEKPSRAGEQLHAPVYVVERTVNIFRPHLVEDRISHAVGDSGFV